MKFGSSPLSIGMAGRVNPAGLRLTRIRDRRPGRSPHGRCRNRRDRCPLDVSGAPCALSRPATATTCVPSNQPHGRAHADRRRCRPPDTILAGGGRPQLPPSAPALPEAVGLPRGRGRQRALLARGRLRPPGRPGHPRLRPGWRDLGGPDEDPAPQHGAGHRLLGPGLRARPHQPAQPGCRRRHRQAVLLRRARGPGAGRPAPRQRGADDDARPRRPRHRPGHPDRDGRRCRSRR